jgi:hypothetical protein
MYFLRLQGGKGGEVTNQKAGPGFLLVISLAKSITPKKALGFFET